MKKILKSQVAIIIVSIALSYVITYGVGFLALGVGGTERSASSDKIILSIIGLVRRNEMAFMSSHESYPKTSLRSDDPEEWAKIDNAQSNALNTDIKRNILYVYILICLIYYSRYYLTLRKKSTILDSH